MKVEIICSDISTSVGKKNLQKWVNEFLDANPKARVEWKQSSLDCRSSGLALLLTAIITY